MKQWIGTLCRAFFDFLLILLVLALVEAGAWYGAGKSGRFLDIALGFGSRALALVPLALAVAMMFAIFSFEKRLRSRLAAWLGTLLFGLLVLGSFAALVTYLPPSAAAPTTARLPSPEPPSARRIIEGGGRRMVFAARDGAAVSDLVTISFADPWPRMRYAGQAAYDASAGALVAGKSAFPLQAERPPLPSLIPDASSFGGVWIWDRLASAAPRGPEGGRAAGLSDLAEIMALCAGFVLLISGFRFASRATRWPLANALLSGPILIGLLVADAYLSGSAALSFSRGFPILPPAFLHAAIEGVLGILLAVLDLALPPKDREKAFNA
jgi:hypothetical protein